MDRPRHVVLLGAIPPPYGGVQVNLMGIRAFLRARDRRVSAINLTGNRQQDHDGLFFPRSGLGVLARLVPERAYQSHPGHMLGA